MDSVICLCIAILAGIHAEMALRMMQTRNTPTNKKGAKAISPVTIEVLALVVVPQSNSRGMNFSKRSPAIIIMIQAIIIPINPPMTVRIRFSFITIAINLLRVAPKHLRTPMSARIRSILAEISPLIFKAGIISTINKPRIKGFKSFHED